MATMAMKSPTALSHSSRATWTKSRYTNSASMDIKTTATSVRDGFRMRLFTMMLNILKDVIGSIEAGFIHTKP